MPRSRSIRRSFPSESASSRHRRSHPSPGQGGWVSPADSESQCLTHEEILEGLAFWRDAVESRAPGKRALHDVAHGSVAVDFHDDHITDGSRDPSHRREDASKLLAGTPDGDFAATLPF